MKKVWQIVIVLTVILISFTLLVRYYYMYANYKGFSMEMFPNNDGIKIVCLENSKITDCTNKTAFSCGEKIELYATVKNAIGPFYACMNMSFFNMPLVCSNKTLSPFFFYEPDLTIPKANGTVTFIEIYWFPPKNYSVLEDFLNDMKSSIKIISLERNVIC